MPDLNNKAIYDLDDPDRPKFTTNELKDILTERNELKNRVNELEEELFQYRPVEQLTTSYVKIIVFYIINLIAFKIFCFMTILYQEKITKNNLIVFIYLAIFFFLTLSYYV